MAGLVLLPSHLVAGNPSFVAAYVSDDIATPCNLPMLHPNHNHSASVQPEGWSCSHRRDDQYFGPLGANIAPMGHLPFFTGCDSGLADEHGNLPLSRIFSDPDHCLIVNESDRVPIGAWNMFESSRRSDFCDYSVRCTHIEATENPSTRDFWINKGVSGTFHVDTLFWLSRGAQEAPETQPPFEATQQMLQRDEFIMARIVSAEAAPFAPDDTHPYDLAAWELSESRGYRWFAGPSTSPWARERRAYAASSPRATSNHTDSMCFCHGRGSFMSESCPPSDYKGELELCHAIGKGSNVMMGCGGGVLPAGVACYPRQVTLHVMYWEFLAGGQYSQLLISAKVYLDDFALLPNRAVDESTPRPTYELRVVYEPVVWLDLLNHLQLPMASYLIFYTATGVIAFVSMAGGWGLVALGSHASKRAKGRGGRLPGLRFCQFFRLYVIPSSVASTVVLAPLIAVALIIRYVFIAFNPFGFLPTLPFLGPGAPPLTQAVEHAILSGRVGLMFAIVGVYLLRESIRLWVPDTSAPAHTVSALRFQLWQVTLVYVAIMCLAFFFSTSVVFAIQPFFWWAIWKTVCIGVEVRIARHAGNAVFFPQIMLLEISSLMSTPIAAEPVGPCRCVPACAALH